VALLSRIFLKEPISSRVWWAAACTAAAVTMLALHRGSIQSALTPEASEAITGHPWGSGHALGHLLLLGAVVCEASYVVIGKRLSARVSPRRVTAIINLWGLALSTPLGLLAALQFDFSVVAPAIWCLLVFYALAASVFTVWLWMKGLQRIPAQKAGIFTVFLPLSSAAVGVGFLNEPWGPAHAAALALSLVAVWLVTQPERVDPSAQPVGPSRRDRTPR
jgi:drug/metabolite transporter (DMT)-like permease